ncbi:helix-turn-helix domain-containing protein [Congregibacter litoralis]|uniref:AraC-type DNA-binding protein domain protein-containing protein n=1 Tax=Congregibacter litoralis KT71 TaxID=314285 RepID=A4A781_9GAMM|nr:AraC family transcriptional regulator [Congregibacter litoralis]EAQ98150.1 AraC-type DNA-binding protein domain protein-containing protein [Congregibacter litoralis KT71]
MIAATPGQDAHAFLLPSTYSRIIARVARLQERDLGKLLMGTGLPEAILMPGDETFISGDQQLQIMKNGRELLGSADFGLRLGEQLQPSAHGPLGYLALCSPDLISALFALRDYLPLRMPWVAVDIAVSRERIHCELRLQMSIDDNAFAQVTVAECFAMVLQSFVEAVLRRPATEAIISFAHRPPPHEKFYDKFLHAPYRFGKGQTSYVLPGELANAANATSDNASYRLTQQLCNSLLEQTPRSSSSMADRVRTLMLLRPIDSIAEPDIARALFVSKRTLARRLEKEGTSYRALKDQFLAELARRYLQEPRQTVEGVAASLGYHDAAAFRKAFKRWTGMTPRLYRQRPAAS